jgi:hypothetical protein
MSSNYRQIKVFYRFDEEFNQFRSKTFTNKMLTFFLYKRSTIFKTLKRLGEFKQRKLDEALNTIHAVERIFRRENEVKAAFYYIKLSRNKTGTLG